MSALLLKVHCVLSPAERRGAMLLMCLTIVGMTLETIADGMIIPTIALLTQQYIAAIYSALRPLMAALGQPTGARLVPAIMLALVGVYLAMNLLLAFLPWRQTPIVYGVQSLSPRGARVRPETASHSGAAMP